MACMMLRCFALLVLGWKDRAIAVVLGAFTIPEPTIAVNYAYRVEYRARETDLKLCKHDASNNETGLFSRTSPNLVLVLQ